MTHDSSITNQGLKSLDGDTSMPETLTVDELLALYRTIKTIRTVENSLTRLFADGEVPGFIHLSVGQEAIAAGICSALGDQDTLATTHRGHGHVLARGLSLPHFFKEVMGKAGGVCGGRGGSMHVADMDIGILGANGIVAAGIPIAMGSAVAHQTRKRSAEHTSELQSLLRISYAAF